MKNDLTTGSVFQKLLAFSMPFFLSYFLQTLYGLADLFIVGQFGGADVITAVSVGSQVMHMVTVMIVGVAMGATVMIGQAVGAKDKELIRKNIGSSVTAFAVLSLIVCITLLFCTDGIIGILTVPAEAIAQTKIYLYITFAGIPFITAYNVISSIFRGLGDSKSPMYFIAVSCVFNIVIDYILIGGCGMQATGAALGTVISQTCSVLFALVCILKKGIGVRLQRRDFWPSSAEILKIAKVGLPVAAQDGFIQISFLVITAIANGRGLSIAAAVGVVEKIIGIMFLVPSSMLSSVAAMAAQNIGAGEQKRAKASLKYGILIVVVCGIVISGITEVIPGYIVGLFTTDALVITFGIQYLRSYVVDCVFAGIHFCFSGYFTACQKSGLSFIHNLLSVLLFRIPLAYVATKYWPDNLIPMGMAAPAGSLFSIVVCLLFLWYIGREEKSRA